MANKPMTNKPMANKPMTNKPMANKPMAKEVPEKKSIGLIYQCVNCGSDYSARTVWQKKCPACSSKTKQEVLNRKSVKPKGD
jgi:DNA-directed RNA polymerase subunit RPC12/RpoP